MSVWRYYRCLEASLIDFLIASATTDVLKTIDGSSVNFQCGRKDTQDWALPLITIYFDAENSTTPFIGSFKRDDLQVIIIDIYAKNEPDRLDLAKWVVDTINNGWIYYTYSDSANPDAPTKVANGRIAIQSFLSNMRVTLSQNVDAYDQHRHRISINVWKSGS